VQLSGLSNKIIKNETKIRQYLKDKDVVEHKRHYELTFRNKPHVLPDDQQKVLSTMGIINSGFATIFSTLNDSEIKFEDAIDSKHKHIPLKTISDVMINIKHQDRTIRKST
jgi:oligoendopeptidase F